MQEDIEHRTVTLAISTTKLTGRVLKTAISKFLAHQKEAKASKARTSPDVRPKGKQSVKELVGQNQGVANIEISDKNIKDFDRVARKYGVDYAVKKDRTKVRPRHHHPAQGLGRAFFPRQPCVGADRSDGGQLRLTGK